MKILFLHGLGQTAASWDATLRAMGCPADAVCPELFGLLDGADASYPALYRAFSAYCDRFSEPLALCGLSLGGVLALHYTADHPDRVRSLALIAVPYPMPRPLLAIQDLLFRLMPARSFQSMGLDKAAAIRLCRTMARLDLQSYVASIRCPALVLCGEKDAANRKSALRLQAQLPQARLCLLPDAGHEVDRDVPEALGRALAGFFDL